jgi:nitrogen fixation protein FixH
MTAKRNIYPALILLLLGSFLCFSLWSAMRAVEAKPQVTDANYYSKGLKYTSTVLEKQAAVALGWRVTTRLDGRIVQFHLNDKEGQPVAAATGSLFLHLAEMPSSISLPLEEVAPGIYQLQLTASMTGEMNVRLEFSRDGARLNRQILLNL